jgi:hypothetical protein
MLGSIQVLDVAQKISDWWGELRAALETPGVASWQHLCELLDQCPSPNERERAISGYCLEKLRYWPVSIHREPAVRWIDSLYEGEPDSAISLINALSIDGAMLGDEGVHMLLESSWLEGLRFLDLRNNMITSIGFARMAEAPFFAGLRQLDMENNRLDDDALLLLASHEELQLRSLDLRGNRITSQGAAALADARGLAMLEVLELDPDAIRPDGMLSIAESEHLPSPVCEVWGARLERLYPEFERPERG